MIIVCFVAITATFQLTDKAVDAEVYRAALAEVYRAVLPGSDADGREPSRRHALIASTYDPSNLWRSLDAVTVKAMPFLDPRVRLAYAQPDTVTSFLRAIGVRSSLPKELRLGESFEVVNEKDLPNAGDWTEFQKRTGLAAGAFSVSRIGYDASRTQALVYVSYQCGTLCGSGRFVLLERAADRWRVVRVDLYIES